MTTPNVVPRANGEGNLGTSAKKWVKMYTTTGFQIGADSTNGTFMMDSGNNGQLIWEGSGVDAHETFLQAANATASDKTLTLPNLTGTLATTDVAGGGTGGTTHTTGSVLLGNGTSGITNTGVIADNTFIVGNGSGAPSLETGATARTSMGVSRLESFIIAASDETSIITAGDNKVRFAMPYAFTVTEVKAHLNTASSSGNVHIQVTEAGASNSITSAVVNLGTGTAAATTSFADSSLAEDAIIGVNIESGQAGTGAVGLKVTILGYQTTPA